MYNYNLLYNYTFLIVDAQGNKIMQTFCFRSLKMKLCYHKVERRYLTLDQLGNVLKILKSSHLGNFPSL